MQEGGSHIYIWWKALQAEEVSVQRLWGRQELDMLLEQKEGQ